MQKKYREEASNAGKYNCPMCVNMITKRNLSICMQCQSGDKFIQRPLSPLEEDFALKKA